MDAVELSENPRLPTISTPNQSALTPVKCTFWHIFRFHRHPRHPTIIIITAVEVSAKN